jgi:RNA polymerase sigma factor (sigma-70 family)
VTAAYAEDLPKRWNAVLEHRDRALRVARARLSDPYDVDDCVQEGMTRVVAMPGLDLGRVGPLLSTVVANVAADTHRQHMRSARLRAKVTWSERPSAPHDEPVCDAAEARWLLAQLDGLAPRERAVLELRASGRSMAQTAAELGMSYKAVESAFTRGRNAVKLLWRATLGAMAVLVGRVLRPAAPATTAAVVVAAISLVITVLHPGGQGSRIGTAPSSAPSVTLSTATELQQPVVDRSRVEHIAPAPAAHRHARARPVTAQELAKVHTANTGLYRTPPVRETREHGEESLAQTLERCLKQGVHVSPSKVRCRG